MNFSLFLIISPWKRVWPFIWTNMNSLHPRMVYAKFDWNRTSRSWKEDFKISFMQFRYTSKKGVTLHLNLNLLHLKMLCAKFGWNWPSGSGEEDRHGKSLRRRRRQRRRTTDKFCLERLTWVFGSGELKITTYYYVKTLRPTYI